MHTEPPDEALLSAYRKGNKEAEEKLFQRYYSRLIYLARGKMGAKLKALEGASDIVQSVMRSFFGRAREKQIDVEPEENLWPLLVKITVNKIRNRAKRYGTQKRDPDRVQLLEVIDPLERGPSPDHVIMMKDEREHLLEQFSGRRRRILEMILEGFGVKEIAEQLDTTERTVYNTRQAAAKVLQQMLSVE